MISQTHQLLSDLCKEVIQIIDWALPAVARLLSLAGAITKQTQTNSRKLSQPLSKTQATSSLSLLWWWRGRRGRRRGRWNWTICHLHRSTIAQFLLLVVLLSKELLEDRSQAFVAREPSQRVLWRWQGVRGVDWERATTTKVIVFAVLSPECRLQSTERHESQHGCLASWLCEN